MQRVYRINANFPSLAEGDQFQAIEVTAINWAAAMGRAARELKKRPVMNHRRITAVSMTAELIGRQDQVAAAETAAPAEQAQADLNIPAIANIADDSDPSDGGDGSQQN